MNKFNQGRQAYADGKLMCHCPHSPWWWLKAITWRRGWIEAYDKAERGC